MLTPLTRKRVLYHLDYAQLTLPTTLSLGLPITTLARFVVEQNMLNFDELSEPLLIRVLDQLDCCEREAIEARQALLIKRAGETEWREDAVDRIWLEYKRWMMKLGDMLGSQQNPVSNAVNSMAGGVVEGC